MSAQTPVTFVTFNVLEHEGECVTNLPLLDRKELLADIVSKDTAKFISTQALEGIVLKKRKDLRYEVGMRLHSWLKVINYQYADVFVIGNLKQLKEFGWLLQFSDGSYAGVMDLGVPLKEWEKVYRVPIIRENDDFAYIDPIKCRVKYRNLTQVGQLRLPSFEKWV